MALIPFICFVMIIGSGPLQCPQCFSVSSVVLSVLSASQCPQWFSVPSVVLSVLSGSQWSQCFSVPYGL